MAYEPVASGVEIARIQSLLRRHRAGDERAGRSIGEVILGVQRRARRGESVLSAVAERVGASRSALYAYEQLARCWTALEYSNLLRRRGPLGARVYESHLFVIARVGSKARREQLIEILLRDGLTVRALAELARGSARASSISEAAPASAQDP